MIKDITFEQVEDFLPKAPRSDFHEAFEFRFLFAMDAMPKELLVESYKEMLRVTFPMCTGTGRGRIWLRRTLQYEIDHEDNQTFMEIVEYLSYISGLPIRSRGNLFFK